MLIGVVSETSESSSRIRLTTSRASTLEILIPDQIDRTQVNTISKSGNLGDLKYANGVAIGQTNSVIINNLATSSIVKSGDYVLVNDERINMYLVLGIISEVIDDPSAATKSAVVRPLKNFNELQKVFIKINNS